MMHILRPFYALIPLFSCLLLTAACTAWRGKVLERKWLSQSKDHYSIQKGQKQGSATLYYTGCGGFAIDYNGEKILLDPYFSNIGIPGVVFHRLRPDTALINDFFRKKLNIERDTTGQISTILISHAHHDHLGDVPYLLKNKLTNNNVKVFGSRTAINLLCSFPDLAQDSAAYMNNLQPYFKYHATTAQKKSEPPISPFFYTPDKHIRFAAVPSNHVGHYKTCKTHKIPFTKGQVNKPLNKPPYFGIRYKEGDSYNYLIDLLDDNGTILFRIYANAGAASDAGVGYPPAEVLQEKPVDLLLICGANYNMADDYPMPMLEFLQPKLVFVAHWENFFQSVTELRKKTEVVPNTDIRKLMKILEKSKAEKGFPEAFFIEHPQLRGVRFDF